MRIDLRKTPRLNMVGLAVAAALVLSSCGIDGASATDNLSEADKSRIAEEFRDCLAEYGLEGDVSFDGGGIGVDIGGDVDLGPEEMRAVEVECEKLLEDLDSGPELEPEEQAQLIDAAPVLQKCLRDQGYDVEVDGEGGINFSTDSEDGDNFDETEYALAEETCFKEALPELWAKYGEGN